MSTESFGVKNTFLAAADYTAKQYYLMYISAANTVTISGAAGDVVGILYNKPDSGEAASVLTGAGIMAKAIAGGTVAAGNALESDSSGRVVALTIDGDGTTETTMVGRAVTACTDAGAYITVLTSFSPASK